jgi:hypothetical protein
MLPGADRTRCHPTGKPLMKRPSHSAFSASCSSLMIASVVASTVRLTTGAYHLCRPARVRTPPRVRAGASSAVRRARSSARPTRAAATAAARRSETQPRGQGWLILAC